jgi:hypothetical protein
MTIDQFAELILGMANKYFSQQQQTESNMNITEVLAKLDAIEAQAAKVKGEYTTNLAAKDAQIADLQSQVASGTGNVPDEVATKIDNVAAIIQGMDDQNADSTTDNSGGTDATGGTDTTGGTGEVPVL